MDRPLLRDELTNHPYKKKPHEEKTLEGRQRREPEFETLEACRDLQEKVLLIKCYLFQPHCAIYPYKTRYHLTVTQTVEQPLRKNCKGGDRLRKNFEIP